MNPRLPIAVTAACALLVAPAMASATITTYTDRAAWRTGVGSSTGNVVDDLNVAAAGARAFGTTGSGWAVFPNTNATNAVDGTAYLRCMPEPTTPTPTTCTITFGAAITGFVMDVNPNSFSIGATISVGLNAGAGSTSFTLPNPDANATWGLVSTTSFTSITFSSSSGWRPFGIDNLEFPPTAPTVATISPSSGASAGGTQVSIRGYGFTTVGGAPTVTIGGVAATDVTVDDTTTITATTGAGSAGSASVLVTPPGTAGANAANSLFTYLAAARTPTFGTPTPTADGYTVQIANYDASWQWSVVATAGGTATVSNSGLLTVSGLPIDTASTATVSTTRSGYADGSADVLASSQPGQARTPAFGTPTATADGYTVQITNYDANWQWSAVATARGTVTVSSSGLVIVTGVAPGASSSVTVTTTRARYTDGSATVMASALSPVASPPDAPEPFAPLASSLATGGGGSSASPRVAYGPLPLEGLGSQNARGLVMRFTAPRPGTVTITGTTGGGTNALTGRVAGRVVCSGSATVAVGKASVPCRLNARGRAARRAGGARVTLRLVLAATHQSSTVLAARRVVMLAGAPRAAVRAVGVAG